MVAKLPFKFKVVDEIKDLTVTVTDNRKVAVLKGKRPNWSTEEIFFKAV